MKFFKPKPALGSKQSDHGAYRRRNRGGRWTRTSKAYRSAHPICEVCNVRAAQETHHIQPLSEGGDMHDWANLKAVCKACHQAEHGR